MISQETGRPEEKKGRFCPCRFSQVCGEREQLAQLGWARQGMTDAFREACPWWDTRVEQEWYHPQPTEPPKEEAA